MISTLVVSFAGSNSMDTVYIATTSRQPLCNSMAKGRVEGLSLIILAFFLTKNSCTYEPVYNLGPHNFHKITPVFFRDIRIPLYWSMMSIVEIRHWLYFQNNMSVYGQIILCVRLRKYVSTLCTYFSKRLSRQKETPPWWCCLLGQMAWTLYLWPPTHGNLFAMVL